MVFGFWGFLLKFPFLFGPLTLIRSLLLTISKVGDGTWQISVLYARRRSWWIAHLYSLLVGEEFVGFPPLPIQYFMGYAVSINGSHLWLVDQGFGGHSKKHLALSARGYLLGDLEGEEQQNFLGHSSSDMVILVVYNLLLSRFPFWMSLMSVSGLCLGVRLCRFSLVVLAGWGLVLVLVLFLPLLSHSSLS